MAKDTPERFVKLVLAELADIHALVLGIHDYIIVRTAQEMGITTLEAKKLLEKKRKDRSDRYIDDLLKRVDLPKKNQE